MSWNGSPVPAGFPIPYVGRSRHRKINPASAGKSSGVSGNSRCLPHRYMDEGDKGREHSRSVRRVERRLWLSEWQDEQDAELREMLSFESWE